jgi:acyl carrier protein
MNKSDFFSELQNALMLDDVKLDDTSEITLTSLSTLSMIAFIDENFNKQVNASALKNIHNVSDLIDLIGRENIKG